MLFSFIPCRENLIQYNSLNGDWIVWKSGGKDPIQSITISPHLPQIFSNHNSQFYSTGLIACHGTKSSLRSKPKQPQSRACCSGYLYSFVELAMQILWVHGRRTIWGVFLFYVDVNKQEEQHGIIERKCLGALMADDRHLQTGSHEMW